MGGSKNDISKSLCRLENIKLEVIFWTVILLTGHNALYFIVTIIIIIEC